MNGGSHMMRLWYRSCGADRPPVIAALSGRARSTPSRKPAQGARRIIAIGSRRMQAMTPAKATAAWRWASTSDTDSDPACCLAELVGSGFPGRKIMFDFGGKLGPKGSVRHRWRSG